MTAGLKAGTTLADVNPKIWTGSAYAAPKEVDIWDGTKYVKIWPSAPPTQTLYWSTRNNDGLYVSADYGTGTPALKTVAAGTSLGDIAVDTQGAIYIADGVNVCVYKLDGSTQTTLGFSGLSSPSSVAVDAQGAVYVADISNNRVYKLDGSTQTTVGLTGLRSPTSIAVDTQGTVYVVDFGNKRVRKLVGSTQSTVSSFVGPYSIAVDDQGVVYVFDRSGDRVYKWDGSTKTTLGFSSGINGNSSIAVDAQGAVYLADRQDNIRKWANNTETVVFPSNDVGGPIAISPL